MNDFAHQQRTNVEHLSDCGHNATGADLPACLFVQTVEQSPVAISITDARANILYVNPAFTQVTGYSVEEAVGCNESMLSDKRTPAAVYEGLWSTLQRREVWRGHLINRHKAGRPYLADLIIAPVMDEQGQTTHYVGLHRDTTELHALEQTVRNQKVLIESVIDALPMAAVLLDEENRVVLDNNAYKSLVSDLNVKEPVRLFLERLEADLGDEWSRLCGAHKPFRDKEVCIERGASRPARWYSCAGTWFVNGDDSVDAFFHSRRQTYLLLVLSDISRLKRQQEEIRLSAIKSLTAEEEKTGSLREALSAAIHQMQGPMNMLGAVKGMLERRGDPANTGLLDLLGQVLAQGEESVATLQACLPQGDSQAFVPVNLNRILRDTLEVETERLLAAGIEVDWQPSAVLPAVAGVESRLRSLFKQLLDNAIESMSRAGSRQRELRVGTAADGEVVRVWVEDSGPGIAPELRLKVFEPFFTAKGGGRRTGMGLALAQDVVNQHGGMIRVAPDCHQGCRMEVHFHACGDLAADRMAAHA
ncbi:MAG TPA: nitrogen fixation negative regulator NifL [Methylococcaceae bacterium]|nr:nitrogen fixation negative regulator NifL [Methylococcaceae bacterium]